MEINIATRQKCGPYYRSTLMKVKIRTALIPQLAQRKSLNLKGNKNIQMSV